MAGVSTRQQINLSTPDGVDTLLLNVLSTGANLTTGKNVEFSTPSLNLTSGAQTVTNVANSIITNAADIVAEATARSDADAVLTTALDQEVLDRQTAVTGEATTRAAQDATLQTNINSEATTRAAADTALQGNLDAETAARILADDTLTNDLAAEVTNRTTAVTNEATARAAADTTLQQNIDNLTTDSTNARTQLETDLTALINAEKARIDAILSLSTAELDSFREIADAYQSADADLTTLINNLTTEFNALKLVVDTLASNNP